MEIDPFKTDPKGVIYEIPFNPENDCGLDTDPPATITIEGEEYPIHETSNLLYLWEAFIEIRTQKPLKGPEEGMQQWIWRMGLEKDDKGIMDVLDRFVYEHPNIFAEIYAIYGERQDEKEKMQGNRARSIPSLRDSDTGFITQEDWDRRKLYMSQSLDGISDIVARTGVDIDIKDWCK